MALAALIALGGVPALAQAQGKPVAQPSQEVQALKNTVEELRQQIQELRGLIKQGGNTPAASASAAPAASAEGESQESLDARTSATKADIQGLRSDLENYKYDQSRLQERNIPSVTRNTKISGNLVLGYDKRTPGFQPGDSQTTAATATAPGEVRKNGFRAPTATLTFAGTLYRDYKEANNLTYKLGLGVNTTGTNATSNSQVNLTDAYIAYGYDPKNGSLEDNQWSVQLGQQAVPFGLDAPAIDPEVRAVINSALFVSGLDLNTRQIGVVAQGDFNPYVDFTNNYRAPLFGYALGFYNGNGPNKNDNNSRRDWIARATFTLPVDYNSWLRQLQLGASYYRRLPTIATSSTTALTGVHGQQEVRGFDVNWTHLPFSIAYEWAYGKTELAPQAAVLKVNPDGFKRGVGQYINFGYTWGEQFLNSSKQQGKYDDYWPKSYQAFLRLDTFDPNRVDASNQDRQIRSTLGLNVFFAETTRFQINYFKDRNQVSTSTLAANSTTLPKRANGIQAQFQAGF